jgi:hypothetical protein
MLVERTLRFIGSSGNSQVVRVGVDAPTRSSIEGLENFVECSIHLGYENAGRSSVFDVDIRSAIEKALDSVQSFLNALSLQGSLHWSTGTAYDFGDIQELRHEVWQKMGLQPDTSA